LHRGESARLGEVALDDQPIVNVQSALAQRRDVAIAPIHARDHVERAGDGGNALAPKSQ